MQKKNNWAATQRELLLRRGHGWWVDPAAQKAPYASVRHAATLLHELARLGQTPSVGLMQSLRALGDAGFAQQMQAVLPLLRAQKGAGKSWKPLYPRFPEQVMALDEASLAWNAWRHYSSDGAWRLVDDEPLSTEPAVKWLDVGKLSRIEQADADAALRVFTQLAGARSSLSPQDVLDLHALVQGLGERVHAAMPAQFVSRENLAVLCAALLHAGDAQAEAFALSHLRTATDALRLAVASCMGDVSLAAATPLRKLPRALRRLVMAIIEQAPARGEDMARRPQRFKRLAEAVHPGEWAKRFPQAAQAWANLRDGVRPQGFNAQVEWLFASDAEQALMLLMDRPGELARRLDALMRPCWSQASADGSEAPPRVAPEQVCEAFDLVADQVSTSVLLQAMAHFEHRATQPAGVAGLRVFAPKGELGRAFAREDQRARVNAQAASRIVQTCERVLLARFAALPALGACHVAQSLRHCTVPFAQRSAAKALRTVARGTRLPMSADAEVIRLFLWWKNGKARTDIDLSAGLFTADYGFAGSLTYYNLKEWGGVHSGDIVDAPQGAAEFIDLTVSTLRKRGVRYVVSSINSYTEQAFCDLPECFGGWMARRQPGEGRVFDPATVQDRVDLSANTTIALPMVFDLQRREMIWADIALQRQPKWNNLRNNLDSVATMLRAVVEKPSPTLYRLFSLHAKARGHLVADPALAEQVFDLHEGITPFDIDRIRAEFL